MVVEYFLGDPLGSTSITTDTAGAKVSEMRYKPFGEVRYTWKDATLTQTTPAYALTKWTFTGQFSYADDPSTPGVEDFGLLYFNARWVDPWLGRFAQADSIIPGAGNPQAWDRYAYSNNSPLMYVDPTGHFGQCHDNQSGYQCRITQNNVAALRNQWAAEAAARAALLQARRASASLNNMLNCRDRVCESGVAPQSGREPSMPFVCSSSICSPSPADGEPKSENKCLGCVITGASVVLAAGILELIYGIATIAAVKLAGPIGLVFLPFDIATLNVLLIGIELIAQGQNRSWKDLRIDYLPLIPTRSHLFNPSIWK